MKIKYTKEYKLLKKIAKIGVSENSKEYPSYGFICKVCNIKCFTIADSGRSNYENKYPFHNVDAWIAHYRQLHEFEYSVLVHRS